MEQRLSTLLPAPRDPGTANRTLSEDLDINAHTRYYSSAADQFYSVTSGDEFAITSFDDSVRLTVGYSSNAQLYGNWTLDADNYLGFMATATNGIVRKDYLVSYVKGTTTSTIKSAVTSASATWTKGELQGTQPSGSAAGMKFCDASYRYEYMNGASDTDGTSYAWVRCIKA